MKKNTLVLLTSTLLLIVIGVGLHLKIQSSIKSNNIKEQLQSMYRDLDFPGKLDISAISFVFTSKLRIRLKVVTLNDTESGFAFKATRIDAYIPYTSFLTNRNDKIKFEIDKLEIKNISSFYQWYNYFLEKRKQDHKVEVMVPLYFISNSYDFKINNIHFIDYPLSIPSTLILKGIGKKQKISFEIKTQNDHTINKLKLNSSSVIVGEGQLDDHHTFYSKFNMRSKISLIAEKKSLNDEINSSGEFNYHPESGVKIDLKSKGENFKGDIFYQEQPNGFKADLLNATLSPVFLFAALNLKSSFQDKMKSEINFEKANGKTILKFNAKNEKNEISMSQDEIQGKFQFSLNKSELPMIHFENLEGKLDFAYWNSFNSSEKLNLVSDMIFLSKNDIKLTTLVNEKEEILVDSSRQIGPCLMTHEMCRAHQFKSTWNTKTGEWIEMMVHSQKTEELKELPLFSQFDWLHYLKESYVYLSPTSTKFKSSFKNSKLVHIALFKDQYLEYFMQNKELSPMIESPVINLVEVTETSDHQWLMMIPVKYKRKNTLIYLSLGKNKSVKIEQDLKTIFEEKL